MVAVGDKATASFANSLMRTVGGVATVNVTTGGTPAFVDVTFPTGAFPNGVTNAQVSLAGGTTPQSFSCSYQNLTATGMRIYGYRASAGSVTIAWNAFGPVS